MDNVIDYKAAKSMHKLSSFLGTYIIPFLNFEEREQLIRALKSANYDQYDQLVCIAADRLADSIIESVQKGETS